VSTLEDPGMDIPGLHGKGRTFDEAVTDAWDKGRADPHGELGQPGWYKIEASFVRVENPIREYKVIINPGG
jgi:hypothetical protein